MKCQFIAILDDTKEISLELKSKIKSLCPDFTGQVQEFQSSDRLLNYLKGKEHIWGILLIDIMLGEENGITEAIKLRQISQFWKIIFVTGYTDYLSDIFKADPDGLLFKPIDDIHLKEALESLTNRIESEDSDYIFVDVVRNGTKKLKCSDIIYIESKGRLLHIHTSSQTFLTYSKLADFVPKLPEVFIRTHSSYVVNLLHVQNYQENSLTLSGDYVIPISRTYKNDTKKSFFEQLMPTIR